MILKYTFRPVPGRFRCHLSGFSLSAQPFLNCRETHPKSRSDDSLSLFTRSAFGYNAFSQILAIRLHTPKFSAFLP